MPVPVPQLQDEIELVVEVDDDGTNVQVVDEGEEVARMAATSPATSSKRALLGAVENTLPPGTYS